MKSTEERAQIGTYQNLGLIEDGTVVILRPKPYPAHTGHAKRSSATIEELTMTTVVYYESASLHRGSMFMEISVKSSVHRAWQL